MRLTDLAAQAEKILDIDIAVVGKRAAYYAEETDEGYWLTCDDLRYAVQLSQDTDEHISGDIYSHWCNGTGQRMSSRAVRRVFAQAEGE